MKEKKQSLKPTIVVWSIAIMVFIVGNMLSANPVRALNELVFQSPIPQPTTQPTSSPTPDPTSSPTPDPTSSPTTQPTSSPTPDPSLTPTTDPVPTSAVLKINGPESVAVGEKVQLSVEAQNVSGNGLYGVQFEVNFDPSLISVSNLQANPDLSVVLKNTADNIAGKISLVASRQGPVPGLTGNVSLLTFDVTAVGGTGTATLSLANAKMGDPQAAPLAFTSENFTLLIEDGTTTPEPTSTPTGQPTPQPTDEPTPQPTDEPTPQPTDEPTPQPTDEPTPQPTDEPGNAGVSGQVILTGRANNNWSGGTVTVDDTQQSATTDPSGNFTIANVAPGSHSSITADAPGYLPAVCAAVTITAPQTVLLPVNLLSGDVNDDKLADIADATAIGVSFGQTGPNQPTDINRDEIVDIYDLILVSVNFGQGAQTWSCQAK